MYVITLIQELKAPSFADDDGILVWRGLVTSGNRSLGRVSLLAGHKLGVNFWCVFSVASEYGSGFPVSHLLVKPASHL